VGFDLANYKRNPVVLFAHDYRSLPVGKAVSISQVGDSLISTVEFVPADISPVAEQCYQLAAQGFMRGASIGFKPIGAPKSNELGGYDFPKVELLEWSLVPVPAHPDALRRIVSGAISRSIADLRTTAKSLTDRDVRAIVERQLDAADNLAKNADLSDAEVIATVVRNVDQVLAAVDAEIAKTKADERQLEASILKVLDRCTPQQLKAMARGYEQ
jgi:HK97 family phage prohead protease